MVLIGTVSQSSQPSRWWLAVAALLVAAWVVQRFPATPTAPPGPPGAVARPHPGDASQRAQPALRHAHYAPPARDLAHQLRDADDLMAFVERAKIDPASGGYYYALKAYDFCAREARIAGRVPRIDEIFSGGNGLIDVRQLSAWLRISALCRNFPESARDMSYLALAEEGIGAGDPKLALALRLERLSAAPHESPELRDADARADLLARIFAMRDPALLRDLARELQVLQETVSLSLGDEALAPDEGDRVVDALMHIACIWGGACGRGDERAALLSCAHQGVCVPLPHYASPGPDARMQRMVDLLLASNGTALRFAAPEPVALEGAPSGALRRSL